MQDKICGKTIKILKAITMHSFGRSSSFGRPYFKLNLKRGGFFGASVSKLPRATIFMSRILSPDRLLGKSVHCVLTDVAASHHMCTLTDLQGHPRRL